MPIMATKRKPSLPTAVVKTQYTTLTLSADVSEALDRLKSESGVPKTQLIRQAIRLLATVNYPLMEINL